VSLSGGGVDAVQVTGASGVFRFVAPDGEYTVTAQREGYFGPKREGVPAADFVAQTRVSAGAEGPALRMTLSPGGVIAGRVLSPHGVPLDSVPVRAMRAVYLNGNRTLVEVESVSTDDRGEFRLYWLPPGEYVLSAEASRVMRSATLVGEDQGILVRTFFPSAIDEVRAAVLVVAPGAETTGLSLPMLSARSLRLSGRLIDPWFVPPAPRGPGLPPPFTPPPGFFLVRQGAADESGVVRLPFGAGATAAGRMEGAFDLPGILPGRYEIFAVIRGDGQTVERVGRVPVELTSADVEDVEVRVRPPMELSGRIVVRDPGPALPPPDVRVRPREVMPWIAAEAGNTAVTVQPTGDFTIPRLFPGQWGLDLELPEGTYVADLLQDGESVYDDGVLDVGAESAGFVELVLGSNGGFVEGNVRHPEGRSGVDTTVVLVPDGPRRANPMLFRTARPGGDGGFSIADVAPGAYTVFAWEGAADTAWMNPDFLGRFEGAGLRVEIFPGEVVSAIVDVNW
jgi:hypothetical protein